MASEIFKPVNYTIERKGTEISLKKNHKDTLATIFVDATDNRLTIKSLDENIPLEAIQTLTKYLDENFGAKQVFVIPEKLQIQFQNCGFKFVDTQNKNDRLRETSFEVFKNIKPGNFENLEFFKGDTIKNTSKENIEALAKGSNFLNSKIAQYVEQGYPGFQLMCDYSQPFGIRNKEGTLVAFCRVTQLNNGNYYLCDTFVDEKVFGTKANGTAYLYQQIGKEYDAGRILLIAPPDRVEEFEKDYGCKAPKGVMFKFGPPKPELQKVFEEEKVRIDAKIQQESKQTLGLS